MFPKAFINSLCLESSQPTRPKPPPPEDFKPAFVLDASLSTVHLWPSRQRLFRDPMAGSDIVYLVDTPGTMLQRRWGPEWKEDWCPDRIRQEHLAAWFAAWKNRTYTRRRMRLGVCGPYIQGQDVGIHLHFQEGSQHSSGDVRRGSNFTNISSFSIGGCSWGSWVPCKM